MTDVVLMLSPDISSTFLFISQISEMVESTVEVEIEADKEISLPEAEPEPSPDHGHREMFITENQASDSLLPSSDPVSGFAAEPKDNPSLDCQDSVLKRQAVIATNLTKKIFITKV